MIYRFSDGFTVDGIDEFYRCFPPSELKNTIRQYEDSGEFCNWFSGEPGGKTVLESLDSAFLSASGIRKVEPGDYDEFVSLLFGPAAEAYRLALAEARRLKTGEDSAENKSAAGAGDEAEFFLPGGVKLIMISVPPGEFIMGSPSSESYRLPDENPHKVKILRKFWIGKYPVTQKQWKALENEDPSFFGCDENPVDGVTWKAAAGFCEKLNGCAEGERPSGYRFSLPGEAMWEYACRAGSSSAFCFGGILDSGMANFNGNYPYKARKGIARNCTSPVGSYAPNGWGIYDMHGNVREWCDDWYAPYRGPGSSSGDEGVKPVCKILRGGCWFCDAASCRSAKRECCDPRCGDAGFGFRLSLSFR